MNNKDNEIVRLLNEILKHLLVIESLLLKKESFLTWLKDRPKARLTIYICVIYLVLHFTNGIGLAQQLIYLLQ